MNAAIVGAGLMGEWHARAARHAGVNIALVVDPDESRGAALAARFPGAKWTGDSDAISRGGVTSAHICTPLSDHESSVGRAIAAGVNCLVEKPFASDAPATERLLRLAHERGVLVCPSHQYLYQHGVMEAVAAIDSIGPVRQCLALCCTAGARDGVDPSSLAADILPHHLALFRRVSGPGFSSTAWQARSSRPGELAALGSDGATAFSIVVSTSGRPTRNELELIGENGSVHVDLFHGFSVRSGSRVSRASKAARPLLASTATLASATINLARRALASETAFPGLREIVARYYSAIRTGAPAPVDVHETLDVAVARDRILQALTE
jgi:predicted dehydrogenase